MNHPGTIFAILAVAGATSLSGCSVETMQDSPAGGQGGATSQPAEDSPYAATPYRESSRARSSSGTFGSAPDSRFVTGAWSPSP